MALKCRSSSTARTGPAPIRACLTNLKTSPDRAVVAASTFRIPTMAKRRGLALDQGRSHRHARPFRYRPVAVLYGPGDQISGAMLNADKTYRATLQFGEETDSGDLTGNVVATAAPGFTVTEQALRDALSRFRARSSRFRPCTRRSSATASRCTSMRGRVSSWSGRRARSRFTASSCCPCPGRRQRSMSHAVKARTSARWPRTSGARWCYAHLAALRRTHVGPFSLDRAVTLDALQAMPDPKQALLALNELPEGLLPSKTLKDSL